MNPKALDNFITGHWGEDQLSLIDQRIIAIEAHEDCPFCGHEGGLYDETDPESDYGCPSCGAYVDTVTGWEEPS